MPETGHGFFGLRKLPATRPLAPAATLSARRPLALPPAKKAFQKPAARGLY
jgi:hypothetical protein